MGIFLCFLPFREKNLSKNMSPPTQITSFENTMENPFFQTPFFGTKRFFKNINYIALNKTAFVFDPRPQEMPEPEYS